MNRIYQTIRQIFSDDVAVVSELAKNHKKSLSARNTISSLLLTLSASTFAQPLVYDGSGNAGTATLDEAQSIGLPTWMNLASNPPAKGVIYQNPIGVFIPTNADLEIDYASGNTPQFVIGGYSNTSGSEVKENTVRLTQGMVDGPVYGGLAHQTFIAPDVNKTNLPISADNKATANVKQNAKSASANMNHITINSNVQVTKDLYGGNATVWAQAGNAAAGDATTTNAKAYANAEANAEASISTITASSNTINVDNDANLNNNIYGGYAHLVAKSGQATAGEASTNNFANANANANANASSSTITASSNIITVGNDANLHANIYGGYAHLVAQSGQATAGEASASGSIIAIVEASANANNDTNSSTITASSNAINVGNNANLHNNIYGGYAHLVAQSGQATAGEAIVNSNSPSSFDINTYADSSATADSSTITASSNAINVGNDANLHNNIYGGYAHLVAQSGQAAAGEASDSGSSATTLTNALANANVQANQSNISASSNIITLGNGANVHKNIYGGYAQLVAQSGQATGGEANSPNSHFAEAKANVQANQSNISASDNRITIKKGSTVGDSIYGGYAGLIATAGTAKGGTRNSQPDRAFALLEVYDTKLSANNNTINFDGTLSNGAIYGGYTQFALTRGTATQVNNTLGDTTINLTNSRAEAINNTVTFGENTQITSTTSSIYGGYLEYNLGLSPASYDVFTGNTLTYAAKAPITIQTLANFEKLNFTINPDYANQPTALITATDIILGTNPSNMSTGTTTPSKIAVVGIHSGNALQANDKFFLMKATNLSGSGLGETSTSVAQQGISLLYDVKTEVDTNTKTVTATILNCKTSAGGSCSANPGDPGRVNPKLKALSEGYLSSALLVSRGADTLADSAFTTITAQNKGRGFAPFIQMNGGRTRYATGSHIKSKDFILSGGLSYQQHSFTVGALLEAGWGNYDTHNHFDDESDVHGKGKNRYYGLGLLGRYDFTNGLYTDASLRFGRNHNQFDAKELVSTTGEYSQYTLNNHYISTRLGAGYLLPISDKNQLDLSARYLWTRLSGKDAKVAGEPIHFDKIDAQRVQMFGKLKHQYNENLNLNAGLGYEYSFDGKARATTSTIYGIYSIAAPSVKGGTGILSLEMVMKPSPNQNLSLRVKAEGYAGKREGVNVSAKVHYAL